LEKRTGVWDYMRHIDGHSGEYYTAYLHECALTPGHTILLRLGIDPLRRIPPRVWIAEPATFSTPVRNMLANVEIVNLEAADKWLWVSHPENLCIYTGVPDSLNPSKFSLLFVANDHKGEMLCTLRAAGPDGCPVLLIDVR
jgi:hypothetical protein